MLFARWQYSVRRARKASGVHRSRHCGWRATRKIQGPARFKGAPPREPSFPTRRCPRTLRCAKRRLTSARATPAATAAAKPRCASPLGPPRGRLSRRAPAQQGLVPSCSEGRSVAPLQTQLLAEGGKATQMVRPSPPLQLPLLSRRLAQGLSQGGRRHCGLRARPPWEAPRSVDARPRGPSISARGPVRAQGSFSQSGW